MISIKETLPELFNLSQFLIERNISTKRGNKIAFYCNNQTVTYHQLDSYVRKFANLLTSFEVNNQERVVILLPDNLEFIISFLGIIWHGAIPVMINQAASISDIHYMLQDCDCVLIITTQEWKEKLANYELFETQQWLLIDGTENLLSSILSQDESSEPAQTNRDESAFWVYTSGSTGNPKAVMHAHYSPIVSSERYAKQVLKLTDADLIYSAPSMAFSYGLGTSLYFPLYVGASAIISDTTSAFGFINIINYFQPTIFFGIPDNFANILALSEIAPLNHNSLRICVSAGEQLPALLWRKWQEKYQIDICEGIGTTETTHIFISNIPGKTLPGSSGKPVPGYETTLLDKQIFSADCDQMGLLQVTGEGMMLGYWNRSEETQAVLGENTFKTGDYYRYDKDNNYYFLGRKGNLLKIKGMWVIPREIEELILQCKSVKDVIVFSKDNTIEGVYDLCAVVVLNNTGNQDSQETKEIKNFLSSLLPKHKIPKKIFILDGFPRTTTGKIHRRKLLEMITLKTAEEKCNEVFKV